MSDRCEEKAVISIEWEVEALAKIREAAAIVGLGPEAFIRKAADRQAKRVRAARKGLLSLDAAAEYLGVSRGEIVKLISAGKLGARKIGSEWLVVQQSAQAAAQKDRKIDYDMIDLDLEDLVGALGLAGLQTEGDVSDQLSASWCYVDRQGVLVCPRTAWARLGRDQVMNAAREVAKRFVRARDK